MSNNSNFAQTIISSFADQGYGIQINDTTISNNEQTVELELVPVETENTTTGISVYANGNEMYVGNYDDVDFEKNLTQTMLANLNLI